MLKETITDKRKERHSVTQEDFTPDGVVNDLLSRIPEEAYTDFTKTILDNSCGIGNILCVVLQKRLDNCQTKEDVADALKTIYGVELMADNVEECKERMWETVSGWTSTITRQEVYDILNQTIVCGDFFDEPLAPFNLIH